MITAFHAANADDVLPKRADFNRYQAMLNRSPFAVATAPAAPAATPDFAKDLYIANAAHSPDGDIVTIASSSDKNFKKYPTTQKADDGYAITNIEWSDKLGQTKVTITKDGKYATLTFNQALISQPVANVPAPQVNLPPQPGVAQPANTVPPNYIKPAPIPSLPPNMPNVPQIPPQQQPAQQNQGRVYQRGIIQRNPANVSPTPTPGQQSDDD